MKKIDFENVINNVSDKYVEEAASFVPKHKTGLRWVALTACIAIIVTAVPFAFILNKEPADTISQPQTTTTSTKQPTDPEKGLPDGFYYTDIETIQLGTSQLVFNTKFLSDGKNIYTDTNQNIVPFDSLVTPLTELQKQALLIDTLKHAKNYHNKEEPVIDTETYTGTFSMAKYSIISNDNYIETKVEYVPNENISGVESMALYVRGIHEIDYSKNGTDTVEQIFKCIENTWRFFDDILVINEFSDDINIEVYELEKDSAEYVLGATYKLVVTINLDPTVNERKESLTLTFYTDAVNTCDGHYYLSEISTKCNLDREVKIIDEETALKWLIRGYCIGNVGQLDDGCRACTIKHGISDEELIPAGLECKLVSIPGVVYVSEEESIEYTIPFYAFTVPSENEGQTRVAYVPATEISGLNELLGERTKYECAYRDHSNGGSYREDYTGSLPLRK